MYLNFQIRFHSFTLGAIAGGNQQRIWMTTPGQIRTPVTVISTTLRDNDRLTGPLQRLHLPQRTNTKIPHTTRKTRSKLPFHL